MADAGFKNQSGFPLTASQTTIWTGQRLNPTSPLYNTFFRFDISGHLDVVRFESAFHKLIEHSDSLRSVILEKEESPRRFVHAGVPKALEVDSVEHLSDVEKQVEHIRSSALDISECVYVSKLIKVTDELHVWLLNQHHIIADAQSVALQNERLWEFYESFEDRNNRGSISNSNFSEYVEFEKGTPSHDRIEKYWEAFGKAQNNPPISIGTHKSSSVSASRTSVELGAERSARVDEYLKTAPVFAGSLSGELSRYIFFGACLNVFLKRLSPDSETLIGTPNHNRVNAEFKQTIGLLMEILPVRTQLATSDSCEFAIEKFRDATYETLKHTAPGTTSARLLSGINYIYNYIPATFDFPEDLDSSVEWIHPGEQDAEHHLRLEFYDFKGTGNPTLDFDLADFAFENINGKEAGEMFIRVVDSVLDNDGQRIGEIEVSEEAWINSFLNPSDDPKLDDVVSAFGKQVQQSKNEIAVSDEYQSWTYDALDVKSDEVAAALQEKSRGDVSYVGVLGTRRVETIAAILGVLKAGGCYVPLNPDLPAARIDEIIKDAGIETLLVSSRNTPEITSAEFLDVSECFGKFIAPDSYDHDSPAYVIYTSGSTGKPKGAANTRRQVSLLVDRLVEHVYGVGNQKINVALVAPFGFDASVQQIFPTILNGHTLHIAPECARFAVNELVDFFNENEIEVTDGTPAHLRILLENTNPLRVPRRLIIGGEALRYSLVDEFATHYGHPESVLTNVYGLAECGVDSTAYDIDLTAPGSGAKDVPIGNGLKGVDVYVANREGKIQPPFILGEILISGESVGLGYIGSNGDNNRFTKDAYGRGLRTLRTGDLGYFDSEGLIHYIGRRDSQISLNGLRIEPAEIEQDLTGFTTKTPFYSFESNIDVEPKRCEKCLLHTGHPNVSVDSEGVCSICREFEGMRSATGDFFGTPDEFSEVMNQKVAESESEYDCMLLYSGGKDSSYVLTKLVEKGYRVLAYTFDNGFISEGAFRNIERQTKRLGVESIVESIDSMNEIFVESLKSDSTVCSGCFKALTARSTIIAKEKGINVVITGLSRGQIYETKLEELFKNGVTDPEKVDLELTKFRKMFHSTRDRTGELLGENPTEQSIDDIWFADYFRYDDVEVEEILSYLTEHDDYWKQPKDVGFCSSNCLINEVGIAVHSEKQGFHNYEAPLSWDIRIGIAKREDLIAEVVHNPKPERVNRILNQIGFYENSIRDCVVLVAENESGEEYLCAYYTANREFEAKSLRHHLSSTLPSGMIPTRFVYLEKLPVTANGKVDKSALLAIGVEGAISEDCSGPENEIEEIMQEIWADVLGVENPGVTDDFFELGGQSLSAIRIISRLIEEFDMNLAVGSVFANPSVRMLSQHLESEMESILASESEG